MDFESTHISTKSFPTELFADFLYEEYRIGGALSFHRGEQDLTVLIDRSHLKKDNLVMKVINPATDMDFIYAKLGAMTLLNQDHGKIHPALIPTRYGDSSTLIELYGEDRFAYLMEFAEGTPLETNKILSKPLMWQIGQRLALMNQTLATIESEGFDRDYQWAPHLADKYITKYWEFLPQDVQLLIEQAIGIIKGSFSSERLSSLKWQVIHCDVNDQNIFYHRRAVTGIIDLGDAVRTYRICELANCLTYLLFDRRPLVGILSHVTRGYTEITPLPKEELRTIIDFILVRLALSLSIGYFNEATHPEGKNLTESRSASLALLKHLLANPELIETCRKAAMRYGD